MTLKTHRDAIFFILPPCYCCYEVWDQETLIYVGVDPVPDATALDVRHRNREISTRFRVSPHLVVKILVSGAVEHECEQYRRTRLAQLRETGWVPPGNLSRTHVAPGLYVLEPYDGTVYRSQLDIARRLGVSQARVSQAVRNPGATIKGYRIIHTDPRNLEQEMQSDTTI